jgi:tetratricopeptide (TPR) repeat protein
MAISKLQALTVAILLVLSLGPALARAESSPDQSIQREQYKLRRNSRDAGAYHRLGDAYAQKARETGDLSYLTLAEQALRKALEITPGNAGAARHLAYVFSTRHEFVEAAAQARKAIELDPKDGDAYGVLGDAYLELGQYDRAGEAYDAMMGLKSDLASYGRRSGLKNVRGDPAGAIDDLRRAVASGQATGQPRESIAWAQWQLGAEHVAIGLHEAAETQYLAALQTYPGYYRALAGLAQVRVAQGRPDEAAELYGKALAVAPLPEYAVALGDLYTAMGRGPDAKRLYDLVEYIGQLNAVNKVIYNREFAYFYADRETKLDAALALARAEYEVRRDVYSHDVLAWVLYKSGRWQDSLAPMEEALKLGTRDAKLFFHAGMIHRAAGNTARAREYLARALATNPHFHVLHAVVAAHALDELTAGRLAETDTR